MTPAARIAAAIEILDQARSGTAAEAALTGWGRRSRFAGSGDRHAVRDLVFDALRRRRSYAALGGSPSGRGLMIGALRAAGTDPAMLFTGEGHAPAPLSEAEAAPPPPPAGLDLLDCPDWLAGPLEASLGADFAPVMECLRDRAPVFLRVNLRAISPSAAIERLAVEGIAARPHSLSPTALEITEGARRLRNAPSYAEGLVELQDAASQAVADRLPLTAGARVLDYCAGGGGKALALAARAEAEIFAHDADPDRMKDLPARAARAGVRIPLLDKAALRRAAPFDLVFADAPCSGSGSWRRAPEAKWRLTPERLAELCRIQGVILDEIQRFVARGGCLAYATCSLLEAENGDQAKAFLRRNPGWQQETSLRLTPLDGGDGFYLALFRRSQNATID